MQSLRTGFSKLFFTTSRRISTELRDRKLLRHDLPLLVRDLGVFILIFSLILLPVPTTAAAATDKKWGPHADITGKLGDERNIADIDLLIPALQGPDSMLFLNARFQADTDDALEGNFGLGYRKILRNWIIGGYGYYDVRETEHDNRFEQFTLGFEALSENTGDLRFNIYLADEDTENVGSSGSGQITYVGSNLFANDSFEQSLSGFDFEAGGLFPGLTYPNIHFYAGGFYFDGPDVEEIYGPKARVEVRFPELFGWDGSLFEVGGEVRDDSERDTDFFFTARLRIPFGSGTFAKPVSSLTKLEQRMTERVVRDPDIVTVQGGSSSSSPLTYNSAVIEFTHIDSSLGGGDGSYETPYNSLTAASGVTSDIILLHADSVFDGEGFTMADSQRLLGDTDGAAYQLQTDQLGTITLPRASAGTNTPVIQNAATAIVAGNDTEISELSIRDSATGILIDSLSGNVDISNVTISGGSDGILINNSSGDILLDGVDIADASSRNLYVSGGSANLGLSNGSTLDQNANGALFAADGGHSGTVTFSGDTTMTAYNGAGLQFDNADGTYNFFPAVVLDGSGTGGDTGIDISNGSDGTFTFYNAVTINNPAGDGIDINNSSGTGSVTFTDSAPLTVTTGAGNGIYAYSNGDLTVAGSGNTIDATGGAALHIEDTTIDLNFESLASTDNPDDLTYDSGVTLYGVTGAGATNGLTVATTTTVYNSGEMGVFIQDAEADVDLGDVTVDTTGEEGLFIDFNRPGSFTAGTTDVSNTGDTGIYVTNHEDAATFGDTTVTNAGNNGIEVEGNDPGSSVSFATASVYNSAADGINLANNRGTVLINGVTTIDDSGAQGLYVDANLNTVTLNGSLDVTDSGIVGVYIEDNQGAVLVNGDTTVDNSVIGVYVAANGAAPIDFNGNLDVGNSGSDGVQFLTNTGAVTVDGATNIYNSAGIGLFIDSNSNSVTLNDSVIVADSSASGVSISANTDAVAFNSTLDITNTGSNDGMQIANNSGSVEVTGVTTITNAGATAAAGFDRSLDILNTSGSVTFANVDIIDRNGVGINIDGAAAAVTFNETLVDTPASGTDDGIAIANTLAGGNVTFNSATINDSSANGISLDNMAGNFAVTHSTTINDPANNGIVISSSSGDATFNSSITPGDSDVTRITNAGSTSGDGINITNSSGTFTFNELEVSTVNGSGVVASNSGTLNVTDGIDFSNDNFIVANSGNAIDIENTTANLAFGDITSNDSANEGLLFDNATGTVEIAGTATVYNSASNGIEVVDSDISIRIEDIDIDNVGGNGILLENAAGTSVFRAETTDINGTGLAGIAVYNGAVGTVTDFETTIVQNTGNQGIAVENNLGTVGFGLDDQALTTVYNSAAGFAAIEVGGNNGSVGFYNVAVMTDENDATGMDIYDSDTVTVAAGNIQTGNATALEIYNVASLDMTLENVTSINAPAVGSGISLENVGGDFTIYNTATVTNAFLNGIEILDSSVDVEITNVMVDTYNEYGVLLENNSGTYNSTTVNVANGGLFGIAIYNSAASGDVDMHDVDVNTVGSIGIYLESNSGSYNAATVDINDISGTGLVSNDNAIGADVSIGDLTVKETSAQGIWLGDNQGDFVVDNTTTIYNSGSVGIGFAAVEVVGNNGDVDLSAVDIKTVAANATGLEIYNSSNLTISSGTITTANATAVEIYNVATLDVTLDSVTSNNAPAASNTGAGVSLDRVGGSYTVTATTVNNADQNGVEILNSSADVEMTNVDINSTANGDGLHLASNSGTYNSTVVSVDDAGNDGILLDSNSGAFAIDGTTTIDNSGNNGITIVDNMGPASFAATTVYNSVTDGIYIDGIMNTATFGTTLVSDTGDDGVDVFGTFPAGDVTFSSLRVLETGDVGIMLQANDGEFTVTNSTVVYNSGSTGIVAIDNNANINFNGGMQVTTLNGEGIYAELNGGTITVLDTPATDNFINSTGTGYGGGGEAITVIGSDIDMTFDNLTSTDSDLDGLFLDGMTGSLVVNEATTIDNAFNVGIDIYDLAAGSSVTFNSVTVNNSGWYGIWNDVIDGAVTYEGPVSVYNSASDGVFISDLDLAGVTGTVRFEDDLTIRNSGLDAGFGIERSGMVVETFDGDVQVVGTTTIYNSALSGLEIVDSNGTVTYNSVVNIDKSGDNGIYINELGPTGHVELQAPVTVTNSTDIGLAATVNQGDIHFQDDLTVDTVSNAAVGWGIYVASTPVAGGNFTVDGTTTVSNTAADGVLVFNNAGGDVTFDELTVNNTGAADDGIRIQGNSGTFTAGTTTVNNAGGDGIDIDNIDSTVTFGQTTINNAADDGVEIVNTDALAQVTYNSLTVNNAGDDGMILDNNAGDLTVTNTTMIYNSTNMGIEIHDGTGDVTFNTLIIDGSSAEGLYLNNNSGDLVATTGTAVYNSALAGVYVNNNVGIVDLGSLTVSDTGAEGVAVYNSASLTVTGGTIDNTAGDGIFVKNTDMAVSNVTFGGVGVVGGNGVAVVADDGSTYNAAILSNNITASQDGINVDISNVSTLDLQVQGNTITSGATYNSVSLNGDAQVNIGANESTLVGQGYKPEPYTANGAEIDNLIGLENTIAPASTFNSATLGVDLYNSASLGF